MRFKNRNDETVSMVENLGVILSLSAIFVQIWILMSGVESYLKGDYSRLAPSLFMSAVAWSCCLLTALTTSLMPFLSKLKGDKCNEKT